MINEYILGNIIIFLVNVILFLNAKRFVTLLNHGEENDIKVRMFKVFNIIMFISHISDIIFQEYWQNIVNIGYSFVSIYVGIVIYEVIAYHNKKKFGKKGKNEEGNITYDTNYHTRINNIFIFLFLSSIVILSILKLWDMESTLEQKGFLGFILAMIFLTNNHWLPNIIKGLALMNSNRVTQGDIIRRKGKFYKVFDMGLQYTRLINIQSNKRVLLENKDFSESEIANISKKSGIDGYRDYLEYNVAYPDKSIISEEAYDKDIDLFKSIFLEIYKEIDEKRIENKDNENFKTTEDIRVNLTSKYELFMVEAGDYALKYRFSFYYQNLANSIESREARFILSAKHRLNELIQKKAHLRGISLATPLIIEKLEKED